jgi:hypothetical protein
MNDPAERRQALPTSPPVIIKGYLAEALPPASRDPNTAAFLPGEALLNVWSWMIDPANPPDEIWDNTQTQVTIRNTDETLTGEEDCYCEAEWMNGHWSPRRVACAASLVPADWRAANP